MLAKNIEEDNDKHEDLETFRTQVNDALNFKYDESFLITEYVPDRDVLSVLRFNLKTGDLHSHTFGENYNPEQINAHGSVY